MAGHPAGRNDVRLRSCPWRIGIDPCRTYGSILLVWRAFTRSTHRRSDGVRFGGGLHGSSSDSRVASCTSRSCGGPSRRIDGLRRDASTQKVSCGFARQKKGGGLKGKPPPFLLVLVHRHVPLREGNAAGRDLNDRGSGLTCGGNSRGGVDLHNLAIRGAERRRAFIVNVLTQRPG
jgi:hypothetical protein